MKMKLLIIATIILLLTSCGYIHKHREPVAVGENPFLINYVEVEDE